jgi:CDP-paratose 2-epimerase
MSGRTLITGGAGFIGTNMAERLLDEGGQVVILDDLSRPGVRRNLAWLKSHARRRQLDVIEGDVRDTATIRRALSGVGCVFHFAAQVAVTTSVHDPLHDFSVNLGGTLKLLEEARRLDEPPALLFTSTNKVYGALDDVKVVRRTDRYEPVEQRWRSHGIGEDRRLEFCSPYGCSKGGADQYVLDYAKSYGLRSVVFRMSCIYGRHQQGNEDQGWVAHFVRQALARQPITLYGDGAQVRDVLFADDLVDAMLRARDRADALAGHAFNMGGGPQQTISLRELLGIITDLHGEEPQVSFGDWRIGDQRWYVSDTRRFAGATGWRPQVPVEEGVEQLYAWLRDQREARSVASAV